MKVLARFNTEGQNIPLEIVREDGTRYATDRVLDVRRAASLKAGEIWVRYTLPRQKDLPVL